MQLLVAAGDRACAEEGTPTVTTVLTTRSEQLMTLTLNRPERLNAVSETMYESLIEQLALADSAPEIRAVVITGAGRAFCVGADMKAHSAGVRDRSARERYLLLAQRVCRQIQTMDTPVVAAVHGYALGAGAEIAVSADFLVVASDASIGFPEVGLGTFVGGGVTHRLPRLVGLRRATELLLLGERFSGADAYAWGLAYRAVADDDVLTAAQALAATLATKAPLSVGRMKQALRRNDSLDAALESEPQQILALMDTQDWAEGVAAFAERRAPRFEGK
ncbi:enoyl-CoA hydratase/isomerase family protein [Nocardia veterana]|uniref:Enoyl-CoA hydratase/isomerase family protein n=1 Tax=Nocardia veterana TaxID=132249 RepID=A0A7X6RIL9_9NOCA|nr:enoyl-CoA hydratase/isomerase family protein [Nocardia veterana]NKY87291.1 enoyl-CoA hydratase/isomerase family protein [Nocardia veterana]